MTHESGGGAKLAERRRRLRRGVIGEWTGSLSLVVKGYRILARRHRTPYGEIDIIAVRRGRVAFVEVKRRRTIEEARAALTPAQATRVGRAADHWLSRNPRYSDHEIGLDALLVVSGRWPHHLPNALDAI